VNFAFIATHFGLLSFFFFDLSRDDAMAYLLSRSCYIANVLTFLIVAVAAPILGCKFSKKLSLVQTNTLSLKHKSVFTATLLTVCCLCRAAYSIYTALDIWTQGSKPVFLLKDISVIS
jgi:hypothetical protein